MATVTELSAQTIAGNIQTHRINLHDAVIYASGGGARNPVLTERIQELLPGKKFRNFSVLGIDPDAKEAVIFAVLANEMLAGEGFHSGVVTGPGKVNFGKISFP